MIYMFLSNNPSLWDINSLNLPCFLIVSVAFGNFDQNYIVVFSIVKYKR